MEEEERSGELRIIRADAAETDEEEEEEEEEAVGDGGDDALPFPFQQHFAPKMCVRRRSTRGERGEDAGFSSCKSSPQLGICIWRCCRYIGLSKATP